MVQSGKYHGREIAKELGMAPSTFAPFLHRLRNRKTTIDAIAMKLEGCKALDFVTYEHWASKDTDQRSKPERKAG